MRSQWKKIFFKNQFTIAFFIDIEKAYDTVWMEGLKMKLQLKIIRWLSKYLYNFFILSDKFFSINSFWISKYQGNYSELKNIEYGLPQGTILSLHLFNIETLDLVQELENDATMYADDLVFWQGDADVNWQIRGYLLWYF